MTFYFDVQAFPSTFTGRGQTETQSSTIRKHRFNHCFVDFLSTALLSAALLYILSKCDSRFKDESKFTPKYLKDDVVLISVPFYSQS